MFKKLKKKWKSLNTYQKRFIVIIGLIVLLNLAILIGIGYFIYMIMRRFV